MNESSQAPKTCPECLGTGTYRYHQDPNGDNPPVSSRNDAGWKDGWWLKVCWRCRGTRLV